MFKRLELKEFKNIPWIPVIFIALFNNAFPFGFIAMSELTISSSFAWSHFFSLIGLGVFGSGFDYLFYYYMVKEGSAEFASLVTYIVPITAMIWGYLLLQEKISANMVIGLTVVLVGVYLSTSKAKQPMIEKLTT